jgi:hypothetical protein
MRRIFVLLFYCYSYSIFGQVHHWESLILEGDAAQYVVPASQPSSDWTTLEFNDHSWNSGITGIGYGDNDDLTQVAMGTVSVYLRSSFTITEMNSIERILLHMDYDDGFVAYLNGTEIARELMSGEPPAFDQFSDGDHEAALYRGMVPESFEIHPGLLQAGENILAVEVHNRNSNSSDLTANPFLFVGINDDSFDYRQVPEWFNEPVDFVSSELPLVVIDTDGRGIPNDPKISATLGIIYNGEGQENRITDPYNEYNGFCGIELRGQSSLSFDKKSYGIETWDAAGNDVDASFLNFPEEEDFILHGPYSDKTLLNNILAMYLANRMGQYASRTRLVELFINQEYQGVYVLMERIKVEDTRLDIAKLNPDENSGDDLTGGYIIRIDKGNDDGFTSIYNAYNSGNKIFYQYFYPDQDEITPAQKIYIENYVTNFEKAMASGVYRNPLGRHYSEYMHLRSFVDNFIINELSKNVDAYRLSTYFFKDKDSKGGKLNAGPIWDYNLAFGNGDYCGGDVTTGYEYYQCSGSSPFWWDRLLKDTLFTNALSCRWNSLRETFLHPDSLDQFIDGKVAGMPGAIDRNFQRWPTLGIYLWPNPSYFADAPTHEAVIAAMKNWIRERGEWLDIALTKPVNDCSYYDNFTEIPPDPDVVTGLEDKVLPVFNVFPNPSSGSIQIQGESLIRSLRIAETSGRIVYELQDINRKELEIETSGFRGTYILLLETDEGVVRKMILMY